MGKTAFNPLSQWRGRVGGQVYKVVNGKQVVVPYSGTKRKSTSLAQLAVQVRFALAGKFSKITPPEILAGLNGSKQDRRSEFTSTISKRATVTPIDDGFQASIDAPNVIFSKGDVINIDLSGITMNAQGIIAGNIANINEKVDAILVIGVVSKGSDYTNVVYQVAPVENSAATVNLSNELGTGTDITVQLYYVPLTVSETARQFLSTSEYNQLGTGNDEYILNMLLNSVEGAYKWGQSQYVTALTVTT